MKIPVEREHGTFCSTGEIQDSSNRGNRGSRVLFDMQRRQHKREAFCILVLFLAMILLKCTSTLCNKHN
jgi:hypothetical protein